jgi:hypothetical protein
MQALSAETGTDAMLEWNAATSFAGPADRTHAMAPLEKLSQALLLANEYMFVD